MYKFYVMEATLNQMRLGINISKVSDSVIRHTQRTGCDMIAGTFSSLHVSAPFLIVRILKIFLSLPISNSCMIILTIFVKKLYFQGEII